MATDLAPALREKRRGSCLGQLEGLDPRYGLVGWAISETESDLLIRITLEDLLNPQQRWKLADLTADRVRP